MALPVIAGVDRVALTWTDSSTGLTAMNVIHVKENVAKTSIAVAGHVLANMTAQMWVWMANTSRITQIDVTPLDGTSATYSASVAAGAATTGGSGLSSPLPQVAGLIKFSTALRGGSHRGRLYVCNVAEGEIGGRTLIDVATCQTAWTNYLAAMTASDVPLVIASYVNATAETVTSALAETMCATQRRRVRR